jgi:histidyl-tRNA synthetase
MTYRPRPVSGFPEHLPEIRMAEQHMLDRIRATFESYGFASIETPSVEELEVLLAKGETDKEIYTIERLQADENSGGESRLGLHYDLTVPFARYVAQHFNDLVFPFKRYQMQRVWRGERPQAGRFREFTQCDVDVIGIDNLAVMFDAELAAVAMQALDAIGVSGVTLHISNRRILQGFLLGLAVPLDRQIPIVRAIDAEMKVGGNETIAAIQRALVGVAGLDPVGIAQSVTSLAHRQSIIEARKIIAECKVEHPLLDQGLAELTQVMDQLHALGITNVTADLSIARGFDYYTGTVYEGRFDDNPGFGSVVAGGRYEDLAGQFINKKLPGVGISIGFSRLFAKLLADKTITTTRRSPADLLIVMPSEERREDMLVTAQVLRKRGFKVETYHAPQKIGKQMAYAEKKGIPFVWFPPFDADGRHEVKDMSSGVQIPIDIDTWTP